jgi:hypothetical protein
VLKPVFPDSGQVVAPTTRSGILSSVDALQTRPTTRQGAETGAVDLNRLTNEVIQNIDRRIIAERERMGRI